MAGMRIYDTCWRCIIGTLGIGTDQGYNQDCTTTATQAAGIAPASSCCVVVMHAVGWLVKGKTSLYFSLDLLPHGHTFLSYFRFC